MLEKIKKKISKYIETFWTFYANTQTPPKNRRFRRKQILKCLTNKRKQIQKFKQTRKQMVKKANKTNKSINVCLS